jgi:hypothetical protein
VGSTEDKGTPGARASKTGDPELHVLRERMRVDYETRRARDEQTANALGAQVVARVQATMALRRRFAEIPPRLRKGVGASEDHLAARRADLVAEAGAARKAHARKRHRNPDKLKEAVREHCVAEHGEIMRFPFEAESFRLVFMSVGASGHWEVSARDVYTRLRKAIANARALAYRMPTGVGGAPGHALLVMRGLLPVLPALTEPPFDEIERPGRAAFVRHAERMMRVALEKTATDRDLAVLSLLADYCPRGNYKALLRDKPRGLTTSAVIAEEAKCVRRVRAPRGTEPQT